MFEAIVQHCRADAGYAALSSVLTMEQSDQMESFFLAETLKYAYLLFAPDSVLPFGSVVFNTSGAGVPWEASVVISGIASRFRADRQH